MTLEEFNALLHGRTTEVLYIAQTNNGGYITLEQPLSFQMKHMPSKLVIVEVANDSRPGVVTYNLTLGERLEEIIKSLKDLYVHGDLARQAFVDLVIKYYLAENPTSISEFIDAADKERDKYYEQSILC